jgi:hypothetical protein
MTESQENLAELFFSRLKIAPIPGVVLAQFYGALTKKEVGRSEIIMLGKLCKLYGRNSVFFSIIDVARLDNLDEFPYGYINKVCKVKLEKSMESDMAMTAMFSLERRITDIEKEIANTKRLDISKVSKYLEGDK